MEIVSRETLVLTVLFHYLLFFATFADCHATMRAIGNIITIIIIITVVYYQAAQEANNVFVAYIIQAAAQP